MFSENIINEVTKENNNIEGNKIFTKNESSEVEGKDSSFNKLLSLQLLIQKHSGLKEFCKNIY